MPMSKAEKAELLECVMLDGTEAGRKSYVKKQIASLKELGITEDQVSGWTREVYQEND